MKAHLVLLLLFVCEAFSFAQAPLTYQQYIEQSYRSLDKGDTLSAIDALTGALRKEPGNPQNSMLLFNKATLQHRQMQYGEALQSFSTGLFFAPNSTALYSGRAALYCDMDSLDAALKDYNEVLRIDPKHIDALFRKGMIYLGRSDTLHSLNNFKAILTIEPKSLLGRLGLASWNKSIGAYAEAERIYSIIQMTQPLNERAVFGKIELYILWNKPSKALSEIEKAEPAYGKDPLLHYMKGKTYLLFYEDKKAQEAFKKAVALGFPKEEILRAVVSNRKTKR